MTMKYAEPPKEPFAEAVTITDQIIQRVEKFTRYYDKWGAHLLGNGEASQFYHDANKLLERLRSGSQPVDR